VELKWTLDSALEQSVGRTEKDAAASIKALAMSVFKTGYDKRASKQREYHRTRGHSSLCNWRMRGFCMITNTGPSWPFEQWGNAGNKYTMHSHATHGTLYAYSSVGMVQPKKETLNWDLSYGQQMRNVATVEPHTHFM